MPINITPPHTYDDADRGRNAAHIAARRALGHRSPARIPSASAAVSDTRFRAADAFPVHGAGAYRPANSLPAFKSQPSRAAYEFLFARAARILSQGFALITEFSCGKLVGLLKKHKNSRIFAANSLPAFKKYAFGGQESIVCEFCKAKLDSRAQALRHKYAFGTPNSLPALNKYAFGTPNFFPALNKYEFGAPNSLSAVNKHEFGATNSLPATDKHEFGTPNSLPAVNKYAFGAPNSLPALNKHEFGAQDSLPTVNKYEFVVTNFISAFKSQPSRAAYEFLFARAARILSQGFALLTEFSCGKLVGLLKKHKNSQIFVTNPLRALNKYAFGMPNCRSAAHCFPRSPPTSHLPRPLRVFARASDNFAQVIFDTVARATCSMTGDRWSRQARVAAHRAATVFPLPN